MRDSSIMGVENSPSKIKLTSDDVTASSSSANAAVYDIICYYKEESEDYNDTVHAVIENIEKNESSYKRHKPDHRKWLFLRLFGCLLIIILLSSPVYGFVTLYLHHRELVENNFVLIWAPIIYNAVYLLLTPWLISDDSVLFRFSNRTVIILSTLSLSLAIAASGFTFVYFDDKFFPLVIFLYGFIGGSSACIIVGRMFVIINGILNNERLYLINFIFSFAQGVAQFLLPVIIHMVVRNFCHDCAVLILIGALTLHITVITLLVVKHADEKSAIDLLKNNREKLKNFPIDLTEGSGINESHAGREKKSNKIQSSSFNFYPDTHPSDVLLDDVKWKNPRNFASDTEAECDESDDHFLEILDSHRVLNSDGVEILETIAEIDEEEARLDASDQINQKNEATNNKAHALDNSISCHENLMRTCKDSITMIQQQMVNPLRRSMKIFKFYSCVILKSVDVFSYLLFVTLILPNQALRQLRFEEIENVIYLITLMGFCWMVYSFAILKFHKLLKHNFIHYFHLLGLLAKFFGYLFTNQRYSLNGFIFGLILISMGHGNSLHLQETVIKNCFHPRNWHYLRGSIYSVSGFLIFVYCTIFHVIHSYLSFYSFANIFVIFNLLTVLIWIFSNFDMVIMMCNMR